MSTERDKWLALTPTGRRALSRMHRWASEDFLHVDEIRASAAHRRNHSSYWCSKTAVANGLKRAHEVGVPGLIKSAIDASWLLEPVGQDWVAARIQEDDHAAASA